MPDKAIQVIEFTLGRRLVADVDVTREPGGWRLIAKDAERGTFDCWLTGYDENTGALTSPSLGAGVLRDATARDLLELGVKDDEAARLLLGV